VFEKFLEGKWRVLAVIVVARGGEIPALRAIEAGGIEQLNPGGVSHVKEGSRGTWHQTISELWIVSDLLLKIRRCRLACSWKVGKRLADGADDLELRPHGSPKLLEAFALLQVTEGWMYQPEVGESQCVPGPYEYGKFGS
jgi:hypothetical protein